MTETHPLITTIIPTYRRPKLLRRAIRSALNQTFPDIKVCVYDNASGDETSEVVSEFMSSDPRVKYHCHQENIGMVENFLYGMERVDTEYFSFLSDDDVLLPDFYSKTLEAFSKYPEAMFAATQVIRMSEDGAVLNNPGHFPPGIYEPPEGFEDMIKYQHPLWTGVFFRKVVAEKSGLPDVDCLCADTEYELRIASRYPYVVLGSPGAIFSVHSKSRTGGDITHIIEFAESRFDLLRKIENDYGLPKDIVSNSVKRLRHVFVKGLLKCSFYCAAMNDQENLRRAKTLLNRLLSRPARWLMPFFVLASKNLFMRRMMGAYIDYRDSKREKRLASMQDCYGKYFDYVSGLNKLDKGNLQVE